MAWQPWDTSPRWNLYSAARHPAPVQSYRTQHHHRHDSHFVGKEVEGKQSTVTV